VRKLDPVALQRAIGLKASFYEFVKMAFTHAETGVEYVDGWHVEEMCNHLEACWRGDIRKLAIAIPPGCMKSLVTSVLFPVWCWIRDPSIRFSAISYDADLTGGRDGGKVVKLIKSEWFQDRWGSRVVLPTDPGTAMIKTSRGGFRMSTSIRGKYTGQHVHFEVVDDPIKPSALSKTMLDEVSAWRTGTAETRILPPKPGKPGARIYIMQRLHEDDLIGQIEKDPAWTILRFPMYFEADNPCTTKWGGDRRTEEGELLWPERFDAEFIRERARVMRPQQVAAQLQQRPTPDGGLIFNADTFQTYRTAPAKMDQVVLSIDATFKGAETSDFVCIQVWGKKGADFYLLDMTWKRLSFTQTIDAIRAMTRKWPQARAKLIEDKANGPAIIDTLRKEISGIIPVNPEGGKEARANAVEPYFSAGNVYHPDPSGCIPNPDRSLDPVVYDWVDAHRHELTSFPFAKHDDSVDACTQALLYFRTKGNAFLAAMRALQGR
jgi:predicted phage terminase large subunit-like protein